MDHDFFYIDKKHLPAVFVRFNNQQRGATGNDTINEFINYKRN